MICPLLMAGLMAGDEDFQAAHGKGLAACYEDDCMWFVRISTTIDRPDYEACAVKDIAVCLNIITEKQEV